MKLQDTKLKFMRGICGKWLGKKQHPMSIGLKVRMEAFFVKLTEIESVHPKNCRKFR